ncbi:hypothetical protein [Halorussus sp. AFM4]|uniref:hypothetical protein n=1 Tax=Halorussus sp. AFM4 TaxID=3421651 RepID=UPI003EB713F0
MADDPSDDRAGVGPSDDRADVDADDTGVEYRREQSDDRDDEALRAEATEDESWWDEGLVTLLLVAGLALFLFPEPATSGLGVALMAVGAALWLLDWLA